MYTIIMDLNIIENYYKFLWKKQISKKFGSEVTFGYF